MSDGLTERLLESAQRWKSLKERQYQLSLPQGVYASDLPACALLSRLEGNDDEVAERLLAAAARLKTLKDDNRLAGVLGYGADQAAVIALAAVSDVPTEAEPTAEASVPERFPDESITEGESEPCPSCGYGGPDWKPLAPAPPEPESVPVPDSAPVVAVERCPHVGSDGRCTECTDDRVVECYGCDRGTTAGGGRFCSSGEADCGHFFCTGCISDRLSEYGYCEDCSTFECDGCRTDFDRGTEHVCTDVRCDGELEYCQECAEDLLAVSGKCVNCEPNAEIRTCDGCDEEFINSRLKSCADEECEKDYCSACGGDGLNEHGYCDDCATLECIGCDDGVARGTERRCSGGECEDAYCETCAARELNAAGRCSNCTDEEDVDCTGCNERFIESRTTACSGCDDRFCKSCAEEYLADGRCSDCTD